jgi:hypothetical protein
VGEGWENGWKVVAGLAVCQEKGPVQLHFNRGLCIYRPRALQNRKITYSRLIVLSIDQITTLQCYRSLTIHPHLHPADAIGLQLHALHEHEPSHARHSDRRRESCGADRPGTINLEETPLEKKNWEEKKNLEE